MQSIAILIVAIISYANGQVCMDDAGNTVDWFIAMKHPNGKKYSLATSAAPTFVLSSELLDSMTNAVVRTSSQAYTMPNALMYSDQWPDDAGGSTFASPTAHSKGVLMWKDNPVTGIWLIHSLPRWPNAKSATGTGCCPSYLYGQDFMCLTLNGYAAIDAAYQMVQTSNPNFYMNKVGAHTLPASPGSTFIQSSATVGGLPYTMISRAANTADLYAMVSDQFQTHLMVETWQKEPGGVQPSNCTGPFMHQNVQHVTLPGATFSEQMDHSKWAVAGQPGDTCATNPVVCIGDINRMFSQNKRGGGTVCINHQGIWSQFVAFADTVEKCPNITKTTCSPVPAPVPGTPPAPVANPTTPTAPTAPVKKPSSPAPTSSGSDSSLMIGLIAGGLCLLLTCCALAAVGYMFYGGDDQSGASYFCSLRPRANVDDATYYGDEGTNTWSPTMTNGSPTFSPTYYDDATNGYGQTYYDDGSTAGKTVY